MVVDVLQMGCAVNAFNPNILQTTFLVIIIYIMLSEYGNLRCFCSNIYVNFRKKRECSKYQSEIVQN